MGGVTISVEKPPLDFIFSVTTTSTPHTFSLPTVVGGNYDYVVDWGDDSSDHITTYNDPNRIHSYATPATYDITISGTFTGLRFGGSGALNGALVTDIKQWGIFNPGNNIGVFRYCSNLTNLTASDIIDLTGVTTFEQFFYQCANLATIPNINSWDVSGVESMEYAFAATSFNSDISNWDVSNVTNFSNIFEGASQFDQDISRWNVSNVENFSYMFYNTPFNQDISGWDVSSGQLFNSMFFFNNSFDQDIGGWDTTAATNFQSMFFGASAFDQDISGWNIENVTNMANMFTSAGLSTSNYDALLIGWESQNITHAITVDFGSSKYSAGAAATARQALIDDHSWNITDGGPA